MNQNEFLARFEDANLDRSKPNSFEAKCLMHDPGPEHVNAILESLIGSIQRHVILDDGHLPTDRYAGVLARKWSGSEEDPPWLESESHSIRHLLRLHGPKD